MPMHDWRRVEAGIYHAFHHEWISEISRALNRGVLPPDYYALPEQQAAGFGPDVLTLQSREATGETVTATRARPKTRFIVETPAEFYVRKKKSIAVRHVSGDRLVAMVEIVSPGNKNSAHAIRTFVDKACELLSPAPHRPVPAGKARPARAPRRHLGAGRRRSGGAAAG
jgi:hypothetical protein